MQVFVIIKKGGMKINAACECKELIDKGVSDKGFLWNPSNFECKCDKSCDIDEHLDYENCKCGKKLIDWKCWSSKTS